MLDEAVYGVWTQRYGLESFIPELVNFFLDFQHFCGFWSDSLCHFSGCEPWQKIFFRWSIRFFPFLSC